jgi:hypothetical protein
VYFLDIPDGLDNVFFKVPNGTFGAETRDLANPQYKI